MSKYIEVEKPFLDKLRQLNWEVHDQGQGIPQEREKSLRENFKQVLLPKVFTPFLFPHNYSCDLLSKCIFVKMV